MVTKAVDLGERRKGGAIVDPNTHTQACLVVTRKQMERLWNSPTNPRMRQVMWTQHVKRLCPTLQIEQEQWITWSCIPSSHLAEFPPESATEATPVITTFKSPMKMDSSKVVGYWPNTIGWALTLNTAVGNLTTAVRKNNTSNQATDVEAYSSPLSPTRKDQSAFKFPDDHCLNIISKAERSTLINSKLQGNRTERKQRQK